MYALLPIIFAGMVAAAATPQPVTAHAGMKWTGEVIPGETSTFYGDIREIHAQIFALNSDYKFNNATALARRDTTFAKRNKDNGYCGVFATADATNAAQNRGYLASVGGSCMVDANSCIRMACLNTSGLYLCNGNDYQIAPSCSYLATYSLDIEESCQQQQYSQSLSGQEFDTDNYNVVVGEYFL